MRGSRTNRYISAMSVDQARVLDFLLDDHFALWDFADSFPTMPPDRANSEIAVLLALVKNELVEITFGKWVENDTVPVSADDAQAVLLNPASWDTTGRAPGYVIELTERGRALLKARGVRLPD